MKYDKMEKIRYFRSSNKFNDNVNFLSGHDFPLTDESENLSLGAWLWIVFVWGVKMMYILTGALGTFYFAGLKVGEMFTASGSIGAITIELMVPTIYLNLRRKKLRVLIRKINDVLIDSDELKDYVIDTFKPYKTGFIIYIFAALLANFFWAGVPFIRVFETEEFLFTDYTVPAYFFSDRPFGLTLFMAGLVFAIAGSSTISFGKFAVDLYVAHFIAIVAAQYKYVRLQLTEALREKNDEENDESIIISKLKKCIHHHCAVIETGQILGELMALHIGATYIGVIVKFCFLAFGIFTLGDVIVRKVTYTVYTFGCLVQVFMLCSCVHELLDASTSVTEDAFHENWHARSLAVKKIFCTIELSTQMECRLSAYRIVELIVPTMAVILSKSYSLCLLLLTVN